MDSSDWLLVEAGVIFGMMILLALFKRRSRRQGLNQFVRRYSKRQRFIKSTMYETQIHKDDDTASSNDRGQD